GDCTARGHDRKLKTAEPIRQHPRFVVRDYLAAWGQTRSRARKGLRLVVSETVACVFERGCKISGSNFGVIIRFFRNRLRGDHTESLAFQIRRSESPVGLRSRKEQQYFSK